MLAARSQMQLLSALALLGLAAAGSTARADDFGRLDGKVLERVAGEAKPAPGPLTMSAIARLPAVLAGSRSPLLVARSNEKGMARLLVAPALKKRAGGGEPIPVLIIERFDAFAAGESTTRQAHAQDLMLFDGFEFDLDAGQVVPSGQGGDLRFSAEGEGGPRLIALGDAQLFIPESNPLPAAPEPGKPSAGRAVIPGDFGGVYRLNADGQWTGSLELKVGPEGEVSGRFASDLNGTVYPVEGEVSRESPQKVSFRVKYPRAEQDFEGRLFTEGKNALAGTVVMLGKAYGFYALRETAPEPAPAGK
ncbi:biopolymer transporter ExbD [Isosphaeraceae bacterium EP7]